MEGRLSKSPRTVSFELTMTTRELDLLFALFNGSDIDAQCKAINTGNQGTDATVQEVTDLDHAIYEALDSVRDEMR